MHTLRFVCVAFLSGPWISSYKTIAPVVGFGPVAPTSCTTSTAGFNSGTGHNPEFQTTSTCSAASVTSSESESSKRTWRQTLQQGIAASQLNTYHLIWSTGAWKKLAVGTIGLFVMNTLISIYPDMNVIPKMLDWMGQSKFVPLSALVSNIILPFMASACCLLQLWINLLAGGCAGFNTVLGPIRPYFLSILLYISLTTSQWTSMKWYSLTFIRWIVALSPELLHLWNVFQEDNWNKNSAAVSSTAAEIMTTTAKASDVTAAVLPFQATLKLDIPTMGCVACINKINSALKDDKRILEAHSALNPLGAKGGYATVRVASQTRDELDQLFKTIVDSIENAGFKPCHIQSIEWKEISEELSSS